MEVARRREGRIYRMGRDEEDPGGVGPLCLLIPHVPAHPFRYLPQATSSRRRRLAIDPQVTRAHGQRASEDGDQRYEALSLDKKNLGSNYFYTL
ncbi:hypothetical protein GW17_00036580 [Ensete ventricosum]|nr:hypothetical protein GW17_00036580 [Ensete ventricosum]